METFVVRIWVPDRPGALGSVASRIGAVGGDVIGIDILERGDGLAVDEIVVDLPNADVVRLLVREVSEVDGVQVEDVRPASESGHDPRLDALETAAVLIGARSPSDLIEALCTHGSRLLGADWMAVIDVSAGVVQAVAGDPPTGEWLAAYVEGSRTRSSLIGSLPGGTDEAGAEPADAQASDVAWAPLAGADLAVVIGRAMTVRARERHQLASLARIVDARLGDLRRQEPENVLIEVAT